MHYIPDAPSEHCMVLQMPG